eukprot:SAG31_NODE_1155_length_9624_cov_3.380157_4_plen_111_part_00
MRWRHVNGAHALVSSLLLAPPISPFSPPTWRFACAVAATAAAGSCSHLCLLHAGLLVVASWLIATFAVFTWAATGHSRERRQGVGERVAQGEGTLLYGLFPYNLYFRNHA